MADIRAGIYTRQHIDAFQHKRDASGFLLTLILTKIKSSFNCKIGSQNRLYFPSLVMQS